MGLWRTLGQETLRRVPHSVPIRRALVKHASGIKWGASMDAQTVLALARCALALNVHNHGRLHIVPRLTHIHR